MANKKKSPPVYRLAAQGKHRTAAEQIGAQRQIRASAPSSPAFPQVKSGLDTWSASTDAYANLSEQVRVGKQRLSELLTQLHQAEIRFRIDERTYRSLVLAMSGGDPTIIASLGFGAVTGHAPVAAVLEVPLNLVGKAGSYPGSAHLSWTAAGKGRPTYAVQLSADPATDTSFRSLPGTSRRTYKLGDLTPGARYWFRVATQRGGEQSAWSTPVLVIAR